LYSEEPGFKYLPKGQGHSALASCSSRKILEKYLKIGQACFLSHCCEFTIHHGNIKDCYKWLGGRAVAQLVEALRYKPERRGFDSRWCHWN
jgi:hypothetical protein